MLQRGRENRMKSRVLSSVSHEIRTPMNAILGMAEVAMRKDMSPQLKKDIGIIRSSAEGLLGLIDGLLDYSRVEEHMASAVSPGSSVTKDEKSGPNPEMMEEADKNVQWQDPISDAETDGEHRVLIVDDNEINREVFKALLEPYHFMMDEAKNGLEAVTMAAKQQYDMIFMDSQMPVMSGGEACRKIRESECKTKCHTPVIAITADAIAGTRERLLAAGMDEYISKPVDSRRLAAVIEQYL